MTHTLIPEQTDDVTSIELKHARHPGRGWADGWGTIVCAWCYYLRVWLWLLFILGLLRALKNVIYQLSDSTKPPVQTSKVWLQLSRSQWERKQPVRPLSEELGSKNQREATTFTTTSAETVRAAISGALATRYSVGKERDSEGQRKRTVGGKREEAENWWKWELHQALSGAQGLGYQTAASYRWI